MKEDILNQPEAKNELLVCDSQSKVQPPWGFQKEQTLAEALAFDVDCCI